MSENSQTQNAVQQMAEKIMPGIRTDHGGINLGDVIVLILSSVLLLYTGYRSWHFISLSIPADFQILAIVGLWGVDIGMLAWALTWIFGSTSAAQDGVSMTMWVIDVVAMVLTSVIDTIMYADGSAIPDIVKTIAWFGIPTIIVGNAVMAIIYHYTSPATKYRRQQRKLNAKMNDARQKGDHEISEMTETANLLQDYTMKRANALLSIASVSEQNIQLADLEQALINRLNKAGLGHLTGPLADNLQTPPSPAQETGAELNDKIDRIMNSLGKKKQISLQPFDTNDENFCFHCNGPAPVGKFYCSEKCEYEALEIANRRNQARLAELQKQPQPIPVSTLGTGGNGRSPKAMG